MPTKITEAEMAAVVKSILSRRSNKTATLAELREMIPTRVHLSKIDTAKSPSRPGEEVWEQILRNLVSHKREGFVSLTGGRIRLQWQHGPKKSSRKDNSHMARRAA